MCLRPEMDAPPPSVSAISDSESDGDVPPLIDSDEEEVPVVRWLGETGSAAPYGVQGKGKTKGKCKPTESAQPADFVEVFAGSGNVSNAVMQRGMHVMTWDLLYGPQHDMSQDVVVRDLTDRAVLSGARYVHSAPPCNTYSSARWPRIRSAEFPEGLPNLGADDQATIDLANHVTANTFRMMDDLQDAGIEVSVENPQRSLLWRTQAFRNWQQARNPQRVRYDNCQYGKPYKKSTTLWVPGDFLDSLEMHCRCSEPHTILSGWADRTDTTRQNTSTRGSQEYPKRLCTAWAKCVERMT
eukprot:TRINITY_DN10597_c0_g1_i2.p1 TRINITY_DN10597_c0_g1~~TRINITY_DN10597_c0_g1_i2.p1  ORF type:complete len:298 (+),score=27.00 TRINITY_DN10597_c0_g1_i2:49-942(+)